MRSKRVTQKDILFLSISFFVIVALWVGSNLYHAYVTTTISEDLQMQIIPIDGTFDTQTIDTIRQRKKVLPLFDATQLEATNEATPSPEQEGEFDPNSLFPTPTPTLIPDEEITIQEDVEPSQQPLP